MDHGWRQAQFNGLPPKKRGEEEDGTRGRERERRIE
jgi:hypothetical protein